MATVAWIEILDAAGAVVGFASLFAILMLIGRNAQARGRTAHPRTP